MSNTNVEQDQTNVEQTQQSAIQKDLYLNFGNDNTVNLILFSDNAYITTAVEDVQANDDTIQMDGNADGDADGNADGNTV